LDLCRRDFARETVFLIFGWFLVFPPLLVEDFFLETRFFCLRIGVDDEEDDDDDSDDEEEEDDDDDDEEDDDDDDDDADEEEESLLLLPSSSSSSCLFLEFFGRRFGTCLVFLPFPFRGIAFCLDRRSELCVVLAVVMVLLALLSIRTILTGGGRAARVENDSWLLLLSYGK
jgi:hypothetical protein